MFMPLETGNPIMGTLSNSEDPDDNAAFHEGLHCLLRQNRSSEKEIHYFVETYTMGHPDFIVSSCMENSIGLKKG